MAQYTYCLYYSPRAFIPLTFGEVFVAPVFTRERMRSCLVAAAVAAALSQHSILAYKYTVKYHFDGVNDNRERSEGPMFSKKDVRRLWKLR